MSLPGRSLLLSSHTAGNRWPATRQKRRRGRKWGSMTDSALTHVYVLLDRSGSMSAIADDTVGGFAAFIREQRAVAGRCRLSLAQFDDTYERVYASVDIQDVPALDLQPRGSTALHDAMVRLIGEAGAELAALPEDQRPGTVLVAVLTAVTLVLLVILQASLGAATVLSRREVWINSFHVVGGALVLMTSLVLTLRSWRGMFAGEAAATVKRIDVGGEMSPSLAAVRVE